MNAGGSRVTRSVTLVDVARAAGVSHATVSNVFNRPDAVSFETRQRVERCARQLGYPGPDPRGRLLRSGRVNSIGVVTPYSNAYFFDDPYTRELMRGIASVCDERGAGLTLVPSADDTTALWTIGSAIVDGLVVHCLQDGNRLVGLARRRRLPFVAIDLDPGEGFSSVMVEDRRGAYLAARHLLDLGHRDIGLIFPAADVKTGYRWIDSATPHPTVFKVDRERVLGYAEAFAESGIDFDRLPMIETLNTRKAAAIGTMAFLARHPKTTAMLAMSDIAALGAVDGARSAQRSVPGDFAVVGFDDVPEAAANDPALTTIRQPIALKGEMGARLLLDGGEPRNEILPVELVVRATTARRAG